MQVSYLQVLLVSVKFCIRESDLVFESLMFRIRIRQRDPREIKTFTALDLNQAV
jgi:hypothetical protein